MKTLRYVRIASGCLAAVLSMSPAMGQKPRVVDDPAKGFGLDGGGSNGGPGGGPTPVVLTKVISAGSVIPLPQHGNANGGVDHGFSNVGIVFGAKVYGGNMAEAIELYYYIPSNPDNLYREGDYRASSGRIGGTKGQDLGGFYCPEGYAAVGIHGGSGLGVDRVGLVCGKIGDPSRLVLLPALGGNGGKPFKDVCDRSYSSGFLTGIHARSGLWMDSIQGLCQARE